MQHEVKNFGKVNSSKDRLRALLGFVKPNQNEMREVKNLVQSVELGSAETGLAGRENEIKTPEKRVFKIA